MRRLSKDGKPDVCKDIKNSCNASDDSENLALRSLITALRNTRQGRKMHHAVEDQLSQKQQSWRVNCTNNCKIHVSRVTFICGM